MPTIKQRIAVEKLSEVIRNSKGQKNITMGKILRAAGYSQETSEKPKLVTERKGFKELFEALITDEKQAKVHDELMSAVELDSYTMSSKLTDKEIEEIVEAMKGFKVRKILRTKGEPKVTVYFYRPDSQSRDKALDKSYKIKGYYSAEKHDMSGTIDVVELTNYGSSKK